MEKVGYSRALKERTACTDGDGDTKSGFSTRRSALFPRVLLLSPPQQTAVWLAADVILRDTISAFSKRRVASLSRCWCSLEYDTTPGNEVRAKGELPVLIMLLLSKGGQRKTPSAAIFFSKVESRILYNKKKR